MGVDPAQFLQGRTRETEIRRDAAGRWFNGSDRIDHPNLVHSFDGWVDRAEDGRFCLSNAINWAYIAIDGPAYFVKDVTVGPARILLHLSGGRDESLDPVSLVEGPEGALWCTVRQGRCPARFDNHATSKLSAIIHEDEQGVFLKIGAEKVRPERIADPLSLGAKRR